jgi:serine/threonine-protein kinase HipA
LLLENGRAHFMTKRFDRAQTADGTTIRHHLQTLCAMNHMDYRRKGTNSYAQLFTTMRDLQLPYEAFEEAFRRMVFNVMARNCDDHTKNMSFRLQRGKAWELAPAYDITFAHNPRGEWTNQHLMSVNGKFKDFEEEDLYAVSRRFGIGTAKHVIAQVRHAIQGWPVFAKASGVSKAQTSAISKQLLLLTSSV